MATASPPSQGEAPSEETENFFRLVSLLLDCGTDVLRKLLLTSQVFTQFSDLDQFLTHHEETLYNLCFRKRFLSEDQYDQLFPPNNTSADINSFDITLLSCLLINLCKPTAKKDIELLRTLRNEISGHSCSAAISTVDFQSCWIQAVKVITDLAQSCHDATFESYIKDRIKDIECNPQFIQLTVGVLKKWFRDDRELSLKLDKFRRDIVNLEGHVTELEGHVTELTTRIKELEQTAQSPMDPVLQAMIDRTCCVIKAKGDYVYTKQYYKSKKLLTKTGCLLVSGLPGEGKSTLSLILMAEVTEPGRCVQLVSPDEWSHVNPKQIDIVFIDDIFGEYKYDDGKTMAWTPILEVICDLVKTKEIKCILASRAEVLTDCGHLLNKYHILHSNVKLSSKFLTKKEKIDILRSCLKQANTTIEEEEVIECVKTYNANIGFPYCCKLFSSDPRLTSSGSQFFLRPYRLFFDNIRLIEESKLVALIFVFCNRGSIAVKDVHKQRSLFLRIKETIASKASKSTDYLVGCLEMLCGIYLRKVQDHYQFSHNLIYETIGLIYAEYSKEEVIRTCSVEFLCQCVQTSNTNIHGVMNVSEETYPVLALRFIDELISKNNYSILTSRTFLHSKFVEVFRNALVEQNVLTKTLKNQFYHSRQIDKTNSVLDSRQSIMQYLAKSQAKELNWFLKLCLDAMHCSHTFLYKYIGECWKCSQKLEALSIALKEGESWSIDMLRQATIYPGMILPKNKSELVENAYHRGELERVNFFLKAGMEVSEKCLLYAFRKQRLLEHCIEELKRRGKWRPSSEIPKLVLEWAYSECSLVIIDMLIKEGVPVTHTCLYNCKYIDKHWYHAGYHKTFVSESCRVCTYFRKNAFWTGVYGHYHRVGAVCSVRKEIVEHCITNLKESEVWDINAPEISEAMAYAKGYIDIIKVLVKEREPMTTRFLYDVVVRLIIEPYERQSSTLEIVKYCIEKLQYDKRWNPGDKTVVQTLEYACGGRVDCILLDLLTIFIDSGVRITLTCLKNATLKEATKDYLDTPNVRVVEKCIAELRKYGSWDPNEKSVVEILERVCGISDLGTGLVDVYVKNGVRVTFNCLKNATALDYSWKRHPTKPLMVEKCVAELRTNGSWDPTNEDAILSLENAYRQNNLPAVKVLESAGVQVTYSCLLSSISCLEIQKHLFGTEPPNIIQHGIEQLKKCNLWDPENKFAVGSLEKAYKQGDFIAVKTLEQSGVTVSNNILYKSLYHWDTELLEFCIQQLKSRNSWDPTHEDAARALVNADKYYHRDMIRILQEAGVVRSRQNCIIIQSGRKTELIKTFSRSKFSRNNHPVLALVHTFVTLCIHCILPTYTSPFDAFMYFSY